VISGKKSLSDLIWRKSWTKSQSWFQEHELLGLEKSFKYLILQFSYFK